MAQLIGSVTATKSDHYSTVHRLSAKRIETEVATWRTHAWVIMLPNGAGRVIVSRGHRATGFADKIHDFEWGPESDSEPETP